MEQSRQKALEMKDRLVQDFQEIRNNFPANFPDDFPKPKHVKQPNGCYKIIHKPTTSSWRTDQRGKEWLRNVDLFLDYLTNNVEGLTVTSEEIIEELRIAIKGVSADGKPGTLDIMTCSKEAFGVLILCDCLKKEHLPIIRAGNWHNFAVSYTKYLMAI